MSETLRPKAAVAESHAGDNLTEGSPARDITHLIPPAVYERVVALRRDLHQHPELSTEEARTAAQVSAALDRLRIAHRTGVGGHGIVADIPGRQAGPWVALRADLDALPVTEETGLPFASQVPGVMHACGHDGHTSALLGAAALLAQGPPPPVPVRLLWQPAEERAAGAKAMIEAGVLEGVRWIFGGHLDRHYAPGVMAISKGTVNASTDVFTIRIKGTGGHGGRPHESLDAIVVGSLLVTAIQTIVSREVDPARPSVVSVGSFHAGSAPNVIAGEAVLEGTIRAQDPEVREHLNLAVARIARAIGQLHQAQVEVERMPGTPPVVNHPAAVALAREEAMALLGKEQVVRLHTANMGGEDFAYYLEHVPGCYVRFGGSVPGRESFPAHSSRFDFDERALAVAAAWFAGVARRAGARLTEGGAE